MSVPALAGAPTLRIRGTRYPVLLPTVRDPRLHLGVVVVSLHVLGQTAFDFRLSVAQILVSVLTCAVLELGIVFHRRRVILWPASALLTGSGVAFILRVPGTEHGDWWSLHGWWVFAATSAVALGSKYVIRFRGRHVFNPSNLGLVLAFLLLGPQRADPLELWWGPMSPWLALALAIIVGGGLAILLRLHLLGIAVGFWVTFAACIGVLAASGHAMTARWHVGPITGLELWRVLVFSPEILLFLFFMITDPKTTPDGRLGRRAHTVAVAVLGALLIAPQSTEFGTKVAVLGALTLVCAARPLLLLLGSGRLAAGLPRLGSRRAAGGAALAGAAAVAALLVLAGIPARSGTGDASGPIETGGRLPRVTIGASSGVAPIDRATAQRIAREVVADLRIAADALRRRDEDRAAAGAGGTWLAGLWQQMDEAEGRGMVIPSYEIERVRLSLETGDGQGPPLVVAALEGTVTLATYEGSPPAVTSRSDRRPFARTFELAPQGNRHVIVRLRGAAQPSAVGSDPASRASLGGAAAVRLTDVARRVGLGFRHGAFRFGVSADPPAMMGGGLCWLDFDADGWLDLYVVNSYADADRHRFKARGGLPRSALFHNVRGTFADVSRGSGANLSARATGCVAADFDLDGHTDLYVTTAEYDAERDGFDALLWGNGDGTFTEGARAAGINAPGWHAGAAVGDVDGDGRPDLFVAGYTDRNNPLPGSSAGFPTDHAAVRDRLYLNQGPGPNGRSTFREVARQAGLETKAVDHGLGALFTDVDGDGRLDLYVANDADPNRLYVNVPWAGGRSADPRGLGFRLLERGASAGVADPNAGMGVAAADYTLDGRPDLFVTNSSGQVHAAFRSRAPQTRRPSFADARPSFAVALGSRLTGWGVSWVDLDLDGDLDLALAGGGIPVLDLAKDAQRIVVLVNREGRFARASGLALPRVNGRGLAAADFDNDGDVDIAVNSIGGRLVLLRNAGATGHWLEVQLPVFSPGAVVTAVLPGGRTLVREVHAGSSYLSSEDPRVHFGLGRATRVRELRVRYPGGGETRLEDVAVDQILVLSEARD